MSATTTATANKRRRPRTDARGCPLSGASDEALQRYEAALAAFRRWRLGAAPLAEAAAREAPAFVMAWLLQAYLRVCSRDPHQVRSALPMLAHAATLPANRFERQHAAAIAALLDDNYELAKTRLGRLLRQQPRDALALQVAHSLDYLTGDTERMAARVAAVLPDWSARLPGYGAVLAMHAFALEENGDFVRAEHAAGRALTIDGHDARAHHVMAHVFEMSGRPAAGLDWLHTHAAGWDGETMVATHGNWHLALFHLARREVAPALALYDRRIGTDAHDQVADLIDASALLWRVELGGGDVGVRWRALAAAWSVHIDDHFCSFNDIHAMLAFVGARDGLSAQRLLDSLERSRALPTRHGATTRLLGAPACKALQVFGQGNDALAISQLAGLPPAAHRLGGSQAQRDVLRLTLDRAAARRRPKAATKALHSEAESTPRGYPRSTQCTARRAAWSRRVSTPKESVMQTTPAVDSSRYAKVIEVSRRVRWEIERDLIRGRRLDYTKPFLPAGLSLVDELGFLNADERRLLSQIQGRSYAYLFGLVERYIAAKTLQIGHERAMDDQVALEALVRMTDEELKHQALFRRMEAMMTADMPPGYVQTADPNAVAGFVLGKCTWAVLALTLDIELFTQAHYRASIEPDAGISALWKDVFLFHWREESQHAILDELELLREDAKLAPTERDAAVDDLIALVGAVDGILQAQAKADAAYFCAITGHGADAGRAAAVEAGVLKAYPWQYIVSGVMEPRFTKVLFGLVDETQAARIQAALAPLTYAVPAQPSMPLPMAA